MAYDLEEQEKIDALKDWWDKNGTRIVIVAFLVAASILGWRGYQWYEQHQATKAMGYFEALETAAQQNDEQSTVRLLAASEALRKDHAGSAYTSRGLLVAAQFFQENGDVAAAQEQFNWIIANSKESAVVGIARLRLAGLLLEQEKYEAALQQLQQPSAAYVGLYADRRGDVFYAQGDVAQARSEWENAVTALAEVAYVQIVQLKLEALGKE